MKMKYYFDDANERCIYLWPEDSSRPALGPLVEVPQEVYERLVGAKAEYNAAQAAVREAIELL